MKSPSAHGSRKDDDEDDGNDPTPTELPTRPSYVRSPPGRLSDISSKLAGDHDGRATPSSSSDSDSVGVSELDGVAKDAKLQSKASGMEEEQIEKLRNDMNAKLLLQQRMRRSYGSSMTDTNSVRVSPIQEEQDASKTSSGAAQSTQASGPHRTHSSASTQSTDSTKTVRASQPATPAASAPDRTPSYPFPPMSTSRKHGSSAVHRPFTTLSPTVSGMPEGRDDTSSRFSVDITSETSTPAADNNCFMPSGTFFQESEDPRFPTPNLYDMVLNLNAEPGLEQWWATVTNLMHDHFKADRVTLVMPQDPTEIENAPWGQKATFSMNGPEEFVPHLTVLEQTSNAAKHSDYPARPKLASREASMSDVKPQKLHPERLRPRLEARHSYAGHGRETKDTFQTTPAKVSARPMGPQRNVTHAAGMPTSAAFSRLPAQRLPSGYSIRQSSLNDPDFSSVAGGVDAGPYAEIFGTLRALDHEVRPLIEPGGVIRVLDRGRVVTVTRDYGVDESDSGQSNGSLHEQDEADVTEATPPAGPRPSLRSLFGNYRSVFSQDNAPALRDYAEYEQHAASPWSQSPAPSPAIQADEETNPFFASDEQRVEDSFSPAVSPRDYSAFGQVGAIGVDHASTVIHVPLIHPTMSQPMQSLNTRASTKSQYDPPLRSNTLDLERKAPLAILSLLTSHVPYPQNLVQSLKLLGPHLATSLAISQQVSSTNSRAITIRHRRTASGQNTTSAPMTIEPASLHDLVKANADEPLDSLIGSVTSPSDTSGRSQYSPASSIAGTPGWDPAGHGWATSRSVAGTPGLTGTEIVDNYFEAKKRSDKRAAGSSNHQIQITPARPAKTASTLKIKQGERISSSPVEDREKPSQSEQALKSARSSKAEKSSISYTRGIETSQTTSAEHWSSLRPPIRHSQSQITEAAVDKRHSQLHSYGADYLSSFGGLPSASNFEAQTPGAGGHARKSSYPEEMPPPSERLLRTMIDSVPVQIFTAEPDTGKMTWVNSKFMIYRGQEAREVLNDPWQATHPHDRSEFMATWHRSLRTTQQLQQKVRLQRFDGSYRWFYVRAAPLRDKRQKIVHWIGTMMDFHEQHTAEVNAARQQETAASEAKYRALANSSPQIVFAANKTNGVTFCNTQWVHFSGQSEAQALGVGFMDHVHPDDLAKCKLPTFEPGAELPKNVPQTMPPELKRSVSTSQKSSSGSSETEMGVASTESSPVSLQMPQRKLSELASIGIMKVSRDVDGKPSYSTEVRLKSKEGDYRWHLVRVLLAMPLLQKDPEETWYGTCTDINDHKALERDLKETMDEKSRFLSNMSHEIRTPLNGITGMVNFLIDSTLTAEQMEHVNIIRASTEGLRGLINDILDLSKAEAGMIQLNMDWFYVRALIEEVNDLTYAMAIDKGLELNYLVEENVPAQIKGDRFRLRQILLNIIGNAIKFTQKGEVFVRCSKYRSDRLLLEDDELFIKFEVIDTGRGFTDEEADHLFKRFSQIDGSSTRQHGGTGLGLVISRQLAQLHGGDMGAKGVPGKGATFTFSIKATLPTSAEQPLEPLSGLGEAKIPILPVSPGIVGPPPISKGSKATFVHLSYDHNGNPSPKFALEHTQSPSPFASPDVGRESPSASSVSSDPSVRSSARTSSLHSERSSASSYMPEVVASTPPIKLSLPDDVRPNTARPGEAARQAATTSTSANTLKNSQANLASPGGNLAPPMYSILVLSPLKYTREATVQHIDETLPRNVPHQITAKETLSECQDLITRDDPVIFTHIVVVLQDAAEVIALIDRVFASPSHQTTNIVVITDFAQRKRIVEQAPKHDYDKLSLERRLRFIFKPLKPSRFAIIFDPQKEREMSTDRNQSSAQQVAITQKQVFEEVTKRLGNKGKRILLVEDNKINQLVVQKFLKKVSIDTEIVVDGVECTNTVFSHPHGHYSIILCDLHMPNKDGYQTCKEIRQWERDNKYPHSPIIALSANVLGDVYSKCVESGFNSYLTKPVDFSELSTVLMTFMDPSDPSKPHEFMKAKRRKGAALSR